MKNLYIFLLLLLGVVGFGQNNTYSSDICGTDEVMKSIIGKNPEIKKQMDLLNLKVSNLNHKARTVTPLKLTIPVVVGVVEVLGDGSDIENITDQQVNSQIAALNIYFEPAGINFCLAKKNVDGFASTGIIRIRSYEQNTNLDSMVTLNRNIIGFDNCLKIWVVKNIVGLDNSSSVQGFSTFPNTTSIFDGIVMKYTAFGDFNTCGCNTLDPFSSSGKILAHEVGHYFGLYHTFEGGCSGANLATCSTSGDLVCDTPPVIQPNRGCPIGIDTCSDYLNRPDDINNYMDYVNENCMLGFTTGQIQRMKDIINLSRPLLVDPANIIATGVQCISTQLTANFSASKYSACSNNGLVNFSGSNNNPVGSTYSWVFGDSSSTQNSSTLQNPSHQFNTANSLPYNVTLSVSDGLNTVSNTKQIFVSNCSPILNTETNWTFGVSAGLNFSSGVPVPVITNRRFNYYLEAYGSQSDSQGNFLFDCNGEEITDSNNINSIAPSVSDGKSAYDGVVIVPHPSDSSKYFTFYRSEASSRLFENGFRYSVVNVSGTSVTSNPTNVLVSSPTGLNYISSNVVGNGVIGGEGIAAAKGCDGYWIVTSGKTTIGYNILVYKLNHLGVVSLAKEIPITAIDNTPPNSLYPSYLISFEFSPDGNKLLLNTAGGINLPHTLLYDFNKFTGDVSSNFLELGNFNGFGMSNFSFSPNSKVLYLCDRFGLYQYNLNNSDILASKKTVMSSRTQSIQRGPDGKLYIIVRQDSKKMGVIHKPNNIITNLDPNACFFSNDGPTFESFTTNNVNIGFNLPNMIDASTSTVFNNTISSYANGCNSYKFFPNVCETSFNWNFGDSASGSNNTSSLTIPEHTYSIPGTYTITLLNSVTNQFIASTSVIISNVSTPLILGNTTVSIGQESITNNSVLLQQGETIVWSATGGNIIGFNNESNVSINWNSLPANLVATITNASGCIKSSTITITNIPLITTTFNAIAPICSGLTMSPLLTTSTNGVSGSWFPDFKNLVTTSYLFTPAAGQNATTANLTITVLPISDPSCLANSCLPNLTLSAPEANSAITYKRVNWIETMANYTTAISQNITMKAGDFISLKSGTHIKSGSLFLGKTEACVAIATRISTQEKDNFNSKSSIINIYPNPTRDYVTIGSPTSILKSIIITSLEGKIIFTNNFVNNNQIDIDVKSYGNGLYIVSILTQDGIITNQKLLKN
ncbi:PKD domain-containing protein [Flavobacterium sp.]|uniref:PKD domain-containing protein n=1 Tax=Flavobacterium sp. TaxID=239 RepID=UPI00286E1428|nr:PKD domain-containing protein [Flavobacterium sp.]